MISYIDGCHMSHVRIEDSSLGLGFSMMSHNMTWCHTSITSHILHRTL